MLTTEKLRTDDLDKEVMALEIDLSDLWTKVAGKTQTEWRIEDWGLEIGD